MKPYIIPFLLLSVTWFLLSGHYDSLINAFGAGSCLAVVLIAWRMDKIGDDRGEYLLGFRVILYLPWLVLEIIKSNFHIAQVVLSPNMPIRRRLLKVKANQRSILGKVVHANSITLTPGTITLDLCNDNLLIHALTKESAQGVLDGVIDRKVTALEGRRV